VTGVGAGGIDDNGGTGPTVQEFIISSKLTKSAYVETDTCIHAIPRTNKLIKDVSLTCTLGECLHWQGHAARGREGHHAHEIHGRWHDLVDVAVQAMAEADGRFVDEGLEAVAARAWRRADTTGVGEVVHARRQADQRWQTICYFLFR
jgi:hypothetical protein